MASNGGQNFKIGNNCKNANITFEHHDVTIIRNGNHEPASVNVDLGNDTDQLTAKVSVNLPGGNHQQLQQQGPQATGVSRQCSEDTEARQAVSETSDNYGSTS